jgi:ornithine carbamoyltransferase
LRHFLTGSELTSSELTALLERAAELKAEPDSSQALAGKSIALIFERPSTRTRVSFEVGVAELGGHPVVLRSDEMQLSRGESPRDTALVLSRHVDAIAIRTGPDELVEELAQYASVPVINMLTAGHHPTQALADLQTLRENYGHLDDLTLAYVGDGNNVARSLAILGRTAGVNVRIASPKGFELEPVADAFLTNDPSEGVENADAVYADVWVSMNDDPQTAEQRRRALEPYRLDEALLDHAAPHAFALHCLPAHPGEEISEGLLYGERQRIWDQAENRRHAQKALLEFLIG